MRTDDPDLGRRMDALLGSLRDDEDTAPVAHWYSLAAARPAGGPGAAGAAGVFDVWRDDEIVARDQRPGDAAGRVIWEVNRAAAEASTGALCFHAGALETRCGGVLVPAASGSGKSTLVAGLVRAGLGYLTDELAALDLATRRLVPYPKPITLKSGSFAVLPDLGPDRGAGAAPWDGDEWQVAVGEGTGRRVGQACEPAAVVVPRYVPGGTTALTPLTQTEAFFTLALHAVNLLPLGAAGTAALGDLVTRCACFALTVSDLDDACGLLLDLVAGGSGRLDAVPRPAAPEGAAAGAREACRAG